MKSQRGIVLVYLIAAIGILTALGYIASRIYSAGAASVQAQWDAAERQQRKDEMEKANAAALGLERKNEKAKVVYRNITRTVDRYIDRPVYRNVCFDADGLRDANAALVGALTPASKPDKPVPAVITSLRWDGSLSVTEDR